MPAESFLQRFHDLAEIDEDVRCRAAVGVRQDLTREDSPEDLQYALRRLVRGVQSSRQCCRQGFSLALSEVLVALPAQLLPVCELIRQHTELQVGLKNAELKDRLLGRLFAYAAVIQAGCLKAGIAGEQAAQGKRTANSAVLSELSRGLHEIFSMRPYLKAPTARMLTDAAAELVAGGLIEKVPELLVSWKLEDKVAAVAGTSEAVDVHTAGILLELRALYVQAEQGTASKEGLKSWPTCVRKDSLIKPLGAEGLAKVLGSDLAAAPLSDGLSWVVQPFCSWLMQASNQKGGDGLQERVWPALHNVLFPEKASPAAEAQSLRALAEFASQLHEIDRNSSSASSPCSAASLLAGLFRQMPRGLTLLFRTLCWQRAQAHPAAVFAQQRLVSAFGATQPMLSGGKRKRHDEKDSPPALAMDDKTRLAILGIVQDQKGFGTMNGKYQRLWQQALLAPLSSAGVRTKCSALLGSLVDASDTSQHSKNQIYADQLVQLATHTHAPDEVILASLCLLLSESYFEPTAGADTHVTFSLKQFRTSVGIHTSVEDDLVISTLNSASNKSGSAEDENASAAAHRAQWRHKLWSALSGLCRRMSPEQAAKLAAAAADEKDAGDATQWTFAFHGCMSDGTLWALRLNEWWDHIAAGDAQTSAKKKRKAQSSKMRCVVPLTSEDMALRQRCLERCRAILSEPEGEASLPARQRNAICGLPLVLCLALLEEDDERDSESAMPVRDRLEEVVLILDDILLAPTFPDAPKQRAKAVAAFQRERAKTLEGLAPIAAELFVESDRLVKEAARICWRELGEYISDETLTSLCGSVRDVDAEDENKDDEEGPDDEEDDAEEGEEVSAATAAKIARFQKATADLKAVRAAEAAASAEKGIAEADEDEEDEVMLDSEAVFDHLLDEGGGGGESGLLAAFAASGLKDPEAAGPKVSKWQQKLKHRQDELVRKFREVELIEIFTQKCSSKRPIVAQVLQELFDGVLAAARRVTGKDDKENDKDGKEKKKTKANHNMIRMERSLLQRLSEMLSKVLKQVCRPPVVMAASQWHTTSEWAERADRLATLGATPPTSAVGQRPVEVGALLLYWLCALHRARAAADAGTELGDWKLADKLLAGALQDWGSKKGCDKWCHALLGAFAVRVPQVVLRLPWAEQIRTSRKVYQQREQVVFVTDSLLRSLASDTPGATEFFAKFATVCEELLNDTLKGDAEGEGEQSATASQRAKMRREVLRCFKVLLRTNKKSERQHVVPEALCRQISKTVTKVKEALHQRQQRRGEVYQLCLHVIQAVDGPKRAGSRSPARSPILKASQEPAEEAASGAAVSSKKSAKRAKMDGGPEKKKKGFFGDL